jgi:predicted DNA binding CopG/RHH family protein
VTSSTEKFTPNEAQTLKWENGELGQSLDDAEVAPREISAAVDEALALHPISIRLPRNLIESLKLIAAHHKVAYQPLVRDLLTRFAKSEMKLIMRDMVEAQEKTNAEEAGIVNEFIEREMARKRA